MHQGLWCVSPWFPAHLLRFTQRLCFHGLNRLNSRRSDHFFIICMHKLLLLSQQKGYKRMINTETTTKVINPFQRWDTYCFLMAHALILPLFPSVYMFLQKCILCTMKTVSFWITSLECSSLCAWRKKSFKEYIINPNSSLFGSFRVLT